MAENLECLFCSVARASGARFGHSVPSFGLSTTERFFLSCLPIDSPHGGLCYQTATTRTTPLTGDGVAD